MVANFQMSKNILGWSINFVNPGLIHALGP
jgi:hypothetical protein